MAAHLREQISSQTKMNEANRIKCRTIGYGCIILMFILAFQLVHANSYLRKLVTWKNVQQASIDTLDKTIVIADKTLTDAQNFINTKIAETKQFIDEKQVKSCDELRFELAECKAAKQPGVDCPTITCPKHEPPKPCPISNCPKCEDQKPCPHTDDKTPSPAQTPSQSQGANDSEKDLVSLQLNLKKFVKPVIDLLPPKISIKINSQVQSLDFTQKTRDIAAQTVFLNEHLKRIIAQEDCNIALDCENNFGRDCLEQTFSKDLLTQYKFLYNAISAEPKKRLDKEILQEKCNIKRLLEEIVSNAKKVNPIDDNNFGQGCSPSPNQKYHHLTYLNDFLSVLFAGTESANACN